jgi:hypothetical protein
MPNLTNTFYKLTGTNKTRHYIETGIYQGDGLKNILSSYEFIHAIELSEKWVEFNREQFKAHQNIFIHQGDSKKILPSVLKDIDSPVTIFLDAHYSGAYTAMGEEETPLLNELQILKSRPNDDIIIIDDCRLIGRKGLAGRKPDDPIYPRMEFDWTNISNSIIKNLLKDNYCIFTNHIHKFTDGNPDQYICFKKPNWLL